MTQYNPVASFPWIKAGEPVEGSVSTPAGPDGVANRPIAALLDNTEFLRVRTGAVFPLLEPEAYNANFNAAKDKSYDITVNSNLTITFPTIPTTGDTFRLRMVAGDRTKTVTLQGSGKLINKNNQIVLSANYWNYLFTYDGSEWVARDAVSTDLITFSGVTLSSYLTSLSNQSIKMGIILIQASTTASVGWGHAMDTTTGPLTLTLPPVATCQDGDRVRVYDAKSTFGTYALTIARNGALIAGDAADYRLANDNEAIDLLFIAGNWIPTSNAAYGIGGMLIGPNKNSSFTAVKGYLNPVLSSGAGLTLTLPANPAVGDTVGFLDYLFNWDVSPVTIERNGKPINGKASNVIHRDIGTSVTYRFIDETIGWSATSITFAGQDGKDIRSRRIVDVNTNIQPGQGLWVSTGVTSVTITLPAAPPVDSVVWIGDYSGNAVTNPIIVNRNGSLIMGIADDMSLNFNNGNVTLRYTGTTYGWRIEDSLIGQATSNQRFEFTATSGQTLFTFKYTPGNLILARNGRILSAIDYTATNGTSVTLATGCVAGDEVVAIAPVPYLMSDNYTKAEQDNRYLRVDGGNNGTTQAQFDNSTKVATTAFVQRAAGNFAGSRILSSNLTLTAADFGKMLLIDGTGRTITLPATSSAPDGSAIMIQNTGSTGGTASSSVVTQGSDAIDVGLTTVSSLTLYNGDSALLVIHGGMWRLVEGSVLLQYAQNPTAAQFDNSKKFATTEFVKTAGGSFAGVVTYTTTQTVVLTAAEVGKVIQFGGTSATLTLTMPDATTVPPGSTITLRSARIGGAFVVNAAAGNTISKVWSSEVVTTLNLDISEVVEFFATGSGWVALSRISDTWPTVAQFDNTQKLATTAFVQRALGNYAGVTGSSTTSVTLTPSHMGMVFSMASLTAATITLPNYSDVPVGSSVVLLNTTDGVVTVAPAGSDSLSSGNSPIASFKLSRGDNVTVAKGNVGWVLTCGSAQLGFSSAFGSSQGTNGYQKLPTGVIIQWGIATALGASEIRTVNFTLAYPAGVRSITLTGDGANSLVRVASLGTSAFQLQNLGTTSQNCYWMSIGY